jgi:hypothetical protein
MLTQAKVYSHFIIFSIFFGMGNGTFITTQCVFLLTCFPDARKSAVSFSMGMMTSSIALFIGAPGAGTLAVGTDLFDSSIRL